jgi:lipopolysaccharide assembly outer membrane protein LptD (OstA)
MNINPILATLALITPVALLAASDEAMLLGGKTHSDFGADGPITVSGQAMASVSGDMNVSANAISYDPATHIMVCTGGVTVTSGGHTIQADKLTITAVKADKVFLLDPDGVKINSDGINAVREEHSLFVPSTNWKPDQSASILFQAGTHDLHDHLNSIDRSAGSSADEAKAAPEATTFSFQDSNLPAAK